MSRASYAMAILLPALFVGYAACAGEDASEESNGAAEAQVTTAPNMIGTFRNERSSYGIAVLTLKKDWTYHLEEGLVCIRYPCIRPEKNGTYRLTTMDGSNVLTLLDKTTQVEYLKYILRGDALSVAPLTRGATWQVLTRSDPAWCGVRNDCDLQDLQPGPCAGGWYCASNMCNYTCGPVTCQLENTCPNE